MKKEVLQGVAYVALFLAIVAWFCYVGCHHVEIKAEGAKNNPAPWVVINASAP